jgi:predicted  nucleic acid-binding Zn-ribbon protein
MTTAINNQQLNGNQMGNTTHSEFVNGTQPERVNLNSFGFKQAGVHGGSPESLKNVLEWIRQARYVEEDFDINAKNRDREYLQKKMDELKEQQAALQLEKQHIIQTEIPYLKEDIAEKEQEIQQLKRKLAEGRMHSEFSVIRYGTYIFLTIFVLIFLILFYASVINSAFFRDSGAILQGASANNIGMLLNSIFDARGIFAPSLHLLFVYFGALLFVLFGMLPHILYHRISHPKGRWIAVSAVVLIAFLIDGLLAYKIDKGIHELKKLMRLEEEWFFLTSENFWLVLAFGFGAYMAWNIVYEAMLAEGDKRRPDLKAELDIRFLRDEIKLLRQKIRDLELKINELEQQLAALVIRIEQIERQLQTVVINPQQLLKNAETVYNGWLKFINNLADSEEREQLLTECSEVMQRFRTEHFANILS